MSYYEYKVVPMAAEAPRLKGVRSLDQRFAEAFGAALNAEAADGWEFVRTETAQVSGRSGLLGRRHVETVTVLVFRRDREIAVSDGWDEPTPEVLSQEIGPAEGRDDGPLVARPRVRRVPGVERR